MIVTEGESDEIELLSVDQAVTVGIGIGIRYPVESLPIIVQTVPVKVDDLPVGGVSIIGNAVVVGIGISALSRIFTFKISTAISRRGSH